MVSKNRSKGVGEHHRRRIKTEQKAKVVAVGWGDILYLNAVLAARMI